MNPGPLVIQHKIQSDFVLVLSRREKRLDSWAEQKVSVPNAPGQDIPDRGKFCGPVRCEGKCCSNTPCPFCLSFGPFTSCPPESQTSQENRCIFHCVSKPRWHKDIRTMQGPFTWHVLFQAASFLRAKA